MEVRKATSLHGHKEEEGKMASQPPSQPELPPSLLCACPSALTWGPKLLISVAPRNVVPHSGGISSCHNPSSLSLGYSETTIEVEVV